MSAISGYWLAHHLDTSIAGAMATMTGVAFGLAFLFAPNRGLVAIARRRSQQRWEFAQTMLAIHLFTHEGLPEAVTECRRDHLTVHLRWQAGFSERVIEKAQEHGLIQTDNGFLRLTEDGRNLARRAIVT